MNIFKAGIVIVIISISSLWLFADDDDHEREHEGKGKSYRELSVLPAHPQWKTECASCHQLYHPNLLPERSWKKMMGGLEDHFGENASLDEKAKLDIEKFLVTYSADNSNSRRGKKFLQSIPANESPLRISETSYFKRKHDEVSAATFKRKSIGSAANCMACHSGAEKGDFNERGVKIPK